MTTLSKLPFWVTLLIITLVSAAFYDLTFTDGDEGRYLFLAKTISEGHGQVDIHLPDPKLEALTPPVYPWLLALIIHVAGLNIFLLKAFSFICYIASCTVNYFLLKRIIQAPARVLLIASLAALLPVAVLIYTWAIFAETLYLLLAAACLLVCTREEKPTPATGALLGVLTAAAIAVRPIGIAIIPAIGLHYLVRKYIRPGLACLIAFTVCYVPVVLYTMKALGVPFGYMSHYKESLPPLEMAIKTVTSVATIMPQFLFEALPRYMFFSLFDGDCLLCLLKLDFLITPLSIVVSLLVLAGWIQRAKRFAAFDLYFLFYLLLISTYSTNLHRGIEGRYLIPILFHAFLYLFISIRSLTRWNPRWRIAGETTMVTVALYILLTAIGAGAIRVKHAWAYRQYGYFAPERHVQNPEPSRIAFGRYIEAVEWIAQNTDPECLVVSRKPRHTHLISQRKGFRLQDVKLRDEAPIKTIMRYGDQGPLYILQDAYPSESGYGHDREQTIDPMVRDYPGSFEILFETEPPVTRVWKYQPWIQASQ